MGVGRVGVLGAFFSSKLYGHVVTGTSSHRSSSLQIQRAERRYKPREKIAK